MKLSFLTALFGFVATLGFSQAVPDMKVPAPVKSAFQAKFSTVSDVKWEKEDASVFEAEFRLSGVQMSANFAPDGKWLETETEISFAELPPAVSNAFQKSHKSASRKEAARIELASGKIIYEIALVIEPKGSKEDKGSKGSKEDKGSKGSKEEKGSKGSEGSSEHEFFYDESGKELKGSR